VDARRPAGAGGRADRLGRTAARWRPSEFGGWSNRFRTAMPQRRRNRPRPTESGDWATTSGRSSPPGSATAAVRPRRAARRTAPPTAPPHRPPRRRPAAPPHRPPRPHSR